MKIGYFVKALGETIKDTVYFKEIQDLSSIFAQEDAEEAAEYAWSNNDGWEWLRDGCILTLVHDNKEVGDFDIEVRSIPEFWATEIKKEN